MENFVCVSVFAADSARVWYMVTSVNEKFLHTG